MTTVAKQCLWQIPQRAWHQDYSDLSRDEREKEASIFSPNAATSGRPTAIRESAPQYASTLPEDWHKGQIASFAAGQRNVVLRIWLKRGDRHLVERARKCRRDNVSLSPDLRRPRCRPTKRATPPELMRQHDLHLKLGQAIYRLINVGRCKDCLGTLAIQASSSTNRCSTENCEMLGWSLAGY